VSYINVGFIGVGNLGTLMVRKFMENGVPLTVYDLRKEAVAEMVALGAKGASSCREVAEVSDIVISVVRDVPQTDEVLFSKDGVWEGIKEGAIIILASSISPSYCREIYARAKERALLTLMVGGDDDAVKQCWPVFEAMAKNIVHLGDIGMGQVCKLVNNLAMYANGIVARECVNLGLKAGLDLKKMVEAMSVSTGNSRALMGVGRPMPFPARPPGTREPTEDLGTKDKRLALEMAEAVGAKTPLVHLMEELDLESTYDAYSTLMKR